MNKIITKLIKDGNSTAVRIPKVALEMSNISGTVELVVKEGAILIKKPSNLREGWSKAIDIDKPFSDSELEEWDKLAGDAIGD